MSRRPPRTSTRRPARPHRRRARVIPRALAFALVLLPAGCESPPGPGERVQVRVRNAGTVPMTALAVVLPEGERIAAAVLVPGGATPYTPVRVAYRYAYVEAVVEGRRIVLQPIDYVGERPLAGPCVEYELLPRVAASAIEIRARQDAACAR